ncbi:GntR family transcriptional regulator [Amycolatopsis rhizosphaerae]|uniref:GntR family transcriptional regulator n=1 Tax=Amycolatopsis rhizosphaerae TaxID=2053003 RepID=A0A558BJY0_9PSEU|nr:GntR family transcriptional regulator [Amycolatopsis rhizosphaerae]
MYEKMAEHLAERIACGELAPNAPLPSERELADVYGVSLGAARHATRFPRACGLVMTIRSKRTYIARG